MNRALIITIGIVIILLVLGVWIYLMLFGTPENGGDVFANLGFELNQQETTIIPPVNNQPLETLVDTQSKDALRQLTTRPVAGFAFASTTGGQTVRYVERGTGHIFEINLETGLETILSRTTVPKVSNAVFSPDANTVALTSYDNYQSNVFVGTINDEANISGISLQPNARNIAFESNNKILYTVSTNETTKGYIHNIDTLTQSELFLMNYTNLDVSWGNNLDSIYLTTKPSEEFEGFIYTTENNILTPEAFSAYGLSALFSDEIILTTYIEEDRYTSSAVDADGALYKLPLIALKEKCVFDVYNSNYVWCGAPTQTTSASFVEDWYKGTFTSDDNLWLIDISKQTAQLYANPENLVGRTIDINNISLNSNGSLLTFTNKKDQTLWLYDLSIN